MKISNIQDVKELLSVVDSCSGDVYLTSPYGDKFNLKSKLSQYVAVGALLGNHGDELEIWCENKDDESKVIAMFTQHPELLK